MCATSFTEQSGSPLSLMKVNEGKVNSIHIHPLVQGPKEMTFFYHDLNNHEHFYSPWRHLGVKATQGGRVHPIVRHQEEYYESELQLKGKG